MNAGPRKVSGSVEQFLDECAEFRANARLMREANSMLTEPATPGHRDAFRDWQRRFRCAWQNYLAMKNPAAQEAALDSAYEILVELNQLIQDPRKK
jgi:hypothetical protein